MTSPLALLPADSYPRLLAAPRRPRVCQIMSADLWAGAEVQLATLASYLVERADVDLSAVLFNEGRLACELRQMGVPVTVFDERHLTSVGILIALVRWLRKHPVDIIHTHRCKDNVLGALASELAGVPGVIRTIHGETEPLRGWAWLKYQSYAALDALTLRCFADRIVAVSARMAEGLERSGYRPATVVRIHNGVDLRRVRPGRARADVRRDLGVAPDAPLIGTVGRLCPVKGHVHLVHAARRLVEDVPDAKLLIVGDGPLRADLEGLASRLGIAEACLFAGARSDVYDLVTAMDVFVLPSLHEGIPMALLEAMALGTPVVATAVGGVPEVVAHRATGLLVDRGDEAGLAEACRELVQDPLGARRLATRARRVVEDAFSRDRNGLELMNAYRCVAQEARPSALRRLRSRVARVVHRARALREATVTLSERRRMDRIRRDPSELVAALRSARRVLMVCHGNIIRSPFAARLVAQVLGRGAAEGRISISSGGLAATAGAKSPPAAAVVAARRRVDLTDHVARPITREAVAASDVIFVMEVAHLHEIRRRFPEAAGKAFLLTCLAPEWPLEVRDPFAQDESVFQASFDHIAASIGPIVRLLPEGAEAR